MTRTFLSIALTLLLVHCAWDVNPTFAPVPNPEDVRKSEKAAFLKKPVVQDFIADGFNVDCEYSVCGKITDTALQVLADFKPQFKKTKDELNHIYFSDDLFALYARIDLEASLPVDLTHATLTEFFEVLAHLRDFEKSLGAKLGLPGAPMVKERIYPLVQILRDHFDQIKAEVFRFDYLQLGTLANRFSPGRRMLLLRRQDLTASFENLWSYMGLFFQAQNFFGSVEFDTNYEDTRNRRALETIIKNKYSLSPLLAEMQGRGLMLRAVGCDYYADAHGLFWDMMIGNECDEKYYESVFRDQIRIVNLSETIGLRLDHHMAIIQLKDHESCLDKVERLSPTIKSKIDRIQKIILVSVEDVDTRTSSFKDGKLILKCVQAYEELAAVVSSIP